jgi:hypothetical protein
MGSGFKASNFPNFPNFWGIRADLILVGPERKAAMGIEAAGIRDGDGCDC